MTGLPAEAAATVYLSRFFKNAGIEARPDGEDVRKAARALPGAPAIASAARAAYPALAALHQLAKATGAAVPSLDGMLCSLLDGLAPAAMSPVGRTQSWGALGEADVVFVVERALCDEETGLAVQFAHDLRGDEWDGESARALMPPLRRVAAADATSATVSPPPSPPSDGGVELASLALTPPPRGAGLMSSSGGTGGVPSPLRHPDGSSSAPASNASCYVLLEATTDERRLLSKLAQLETNSRALAAHVLDVRAADTARDLDPGAIAGVVTMIGVAAPFSARLWNVQVVTRLQAFIATNLPFVHYMAQAGRLLFMHLGDEHRQAGAVVASLLYAHDNTQRQQEKMQRQQEKMQRQLEEIRGLLDVLVKRA